MMGQEFASVAELQAQESLTAIAVFACLICTMCLFFISRMVRKR